MVESQFTTRGSLWPHFGLVLLRHFRVFPVALGHWLPTGRGWEKCLAVKLQRRARCSVAHYINQHAFVYWPSKMFVTAGLIMTWASATREKRRISFFFRFNDAPLRYVCSINKNNLFWTCYHYILKVENTLYLERNMV